MLGKDKVVDGMILFNLTIVVLVALVIGFFVIYMNSFDKHFANYKNLSNGKLILTEQIAEKYFGKANPIGYFFSIT